MTKEKTKIVKQKSHASDYKVAAKNTSYSASKKRCIPTADYSLMRFWDNEYDERWNSY